MCVSTIESLSLFPKIVKNHRKLPVRFWFLWISLFILIIHKGNRFGVGDHFQVLRVSEGTYYTYMNVWIAYCLLPVAHCLLPTAGIEPMATEPELPHN